MEDYRRVNISTRARRAARGGDVSASEREFSFAIVRVFQFAAILNTTTDYSAEQDANGIN